MGKTYALIALGSALGGMLRFWLGGLMGQWLSFAGLPWGTILVNISGSFLIGLLAGQAGPESPWLNHDEWRALTMVGVCGGYTTFSSFSLQTLSLLEGGGIPAALLNVMISVIACLAATGLGLALGRG